MREKHWPPVHVIHVQTCSESPGHHVHVLLSIFVVKISFLKAENVHACVPVLTSRQCDVHVCMYMCVSDVRWERDGDGK